MDANAKLAKAQFNKETVAKTEAAEVTYARVKSAKVFLKVDVLKQNVLTQFAKALRRLDMLKLNY